MKQDYQYLLEEKEKRKTTKSEIKWFIKNILWIIPSCYLFIIIMFFLGRGTI